MLGISSHHWVNVCIVSTQHASQATTGLMFEWYNQHAPQATTLACMYSKTVSLVLVAVVEVVSATLCSSGAKLQQLCVVYKS